MIDTCLNKKFSLEEVLQDSSEFTDFLAKKAWFKIKSSPSWKQFVNANNRLEDIENKLNSLDRKLDEVLITLNNGGRRE